MTSNPRASAELDERELSRPVCAIVGSGEGLGRALAARFAQGGYDLALISRSKAGSAAASAAAKAANGQIQVSYQSADANDPETIRAALDMVGPVDVLIYNVRDSFTRRSPLDIDLPDLEAAFRLEVVSALAAAQGVMPGMCKRGFGTVLFSSATAAFRGSATHPLYSIPKFGLRGLSQSLAKAHAADGIHVAHMRLDCDLDVPIMHKSYGDDTSGLADPRDVAETYWLTHLQPKGAWSNEVDIRPHTETWTI